MTLLFGYFLAANLTRILVDSSRTLEDFWPAVYRTLINSSYLDLLIYAGVLACALGIRFYQNAIEEGLELKRLQHQLTQEQLKNPPILALHGKNATQGNFLSMAKAFQEGQSP